MCFAFTSQVNAQCTSSSTTSTCNNNGTMTLNYGGGSPGPYTYEVIAAPGAYANPGPTLFATPSYTWNGCDPGTYTLQISDGAGILCSSTVVVTGTYADPTSYNPTTVAVSGCINGNNGEIHGVLTDGLAPYYYQIIAGPCCINAPSTSNTTGDFTGLVAGTYQVRAFDACGNFVTQNVTIAPYNFGVSAGIVNSVSCTSFTLDALTATPLPPGATYKVKQGATVLASGATLPLTFTSTKNDVLAGVISMCVTDACGNDVCIPTSSIANDWAFVDAPVTTSCVGGVTITSLNTTGTVTAPYTTVVSFSTPVLGNQTIPGNTTPYTIAGVTGATNPLVYYTTITDACGAAKTVTKDLTLYYNTAATFTSCTQASLSGGAYGIGTAPFTYTISPDPNSVGSNGTGLFTNLPDGTYTTVTTDACGKTASYTRTIDHNWESVVGSRPRCKFDTLETYVGIPSRAKSPITITQYNGPQPITGASTVISTLNYTSICCNNDANASNTGIGDYAYFENTIANQTTTYVLVDACGKTDTVTVTNGAAGHQPLVHTTTVTPKCINKGDFTANLTSDAPSDCIYMSYWNITTPASPIVTNQYVYCGNYTYSTIIATDVPVGTYVVKYSSGLACPNSDAYDTVIVKPYVFPKIKSGSYFTCTGGTSNIVATAKFGLPPYQYRILNSLPSGTAYSTPFQSSNIFALPVTESIVNVQVVDNCGNTATKQIPLKPTAKPIIKSNPAKLSGCVLPLNFNLYVDSSLLPGATYEWKKIAGPGASTTTVIDMTPSLPLQLPSDTGTFSVRVVIPGTCYDKTSEFVITPKMTTCLNEIGNYVWNDLDQDGVQDATEVGVAGVTVTLFDNAGNPIASTVTDAYGKYLFTDLPDGTYSVGFTLPANYVFSPSLTPGDNSNNTNSDASTTTGKTGSFVLGGGESDLTVDAGIYQPQPITASLGNYVWNDVDKDGIQDATETGVAGVTVTLYNNTGVAVGTTLTDANGHYQFTDLTPGTYSVGFTLPPTYVFTTQDATSATSNANNPSDFTDSDVNTTTGKTSTVTLVAGENNPGLDAGIYLQNTGTASLGNKVWNDVNNDGIQDANEAGVLGVTVTLYAADGVTVIATTTTDALGNYMFNNLPPAGYVVGFTNLPSGFTFSPDNVGNDTKDSDPNVGTGKTAIINLLAGEVNLTVDAGIYNAALPTGGLGTTVWFDRDNDGIQDAGENGVPGVTVTLYDNTNTPIATTVTDNNGNYAFNNLAPGSYSVGFTNLPAGYGFTGTDVGANDAIDSDPNGLGLTSPVTVVAGGFNPTVDGGIVQTTGTNATASLGDRVWNDDNNNGIQDPGEQGVQGVTVTLYAANGTTVLATTTTDALGNYIFTGLNQGDYVVGFSNLPAGFTFSTAGQGTDPELDANADATSLGKTSVIHLASGEENLTIDAGIHTAPGLASLGNYVWIDEDQNGLQDANETGVAGVSVTLYNSSNVAIATTTTDANGMYQFTGLTPGTYSVGFSNLPNGYSFTTQDVTSATSNANNPTDFTDSDVNPGTGLTATVTLIAGENNPGLDAGIFSEKAALGNYVWNDINNDGIQDANEKGVPGITVNLYDDTGLLVASTVTDAAGHYQFINLEPGDYQVGFTGIPNGATFSPQTMGSDTTKDSNVNPSTGLSAFVSLLAGDNNQTVDAGIHTPSSAGLGNYVWIDQNNNGQQDANEVGLGGVTVTLYDALGNPLRTTVTDQNGYYTFADLAPGTYSVGFTNIPTLYSTSGVPYQTLFTQQNLGGDGTDSDVTPGTGMTGTYTISAGQYNPTVDAGIFYANPLPLVLEAFNVNLVPSVCNSVAIEIKVANEKNVDKIVLQSKLNSSSTFEEVKTFKATNSSLPHAYNYTHRNVTDGMQEYRLVIMDIDNSKTISDTKTINIACNNSNTISVYPNPTTKVINVQFNVTENATYNYKLIDVLGNTVMQNTVEVSATHSIITLPVDALPVGVYNLVLNNGTELKTIRVTKK